MMSKRRRGLWAASVGAGVTLLMACSPTGVCGCSPIVAWQALEGVVRTQSGSPIADAAVIATVTSSSIPAADYSLRDSTNASTTGAFRLEIYDDVRSGEVNVDLIAVRVIGANADTVQRTISMSPSFEQQDAVVVDLVFPDLQPTPR